MQYNLPPTTNLECHIPKGYGYEDDEAIHAVYTQYRDHQIPLDGLHIDVDFQVGYWHWGGGIRQISLC